MGAYVEYSEAGGGRHTDVRYVLQGGGSGDNSLWFKEVSDDPIHPLGPGSISKLDHATPHWPPTRSISQMTAGYT